MGEVLYSKYSRERKRCYQIETALIREYDGSLSIRKRALTPEAQHHIGKIYENHQIMTNRYGEEHTLAVRNVEPSHISFAMVEGEKWSERFLALLERNDRRLFLKEIDTYCAFLAAKEVDEEKEAEGVFENPYAQTRSVNIRMDLKHLVICDGVPKIMNYEWLYPDISDNFLLFYSIAGLREGIRLNEMFSIEDILVYFKIPQAKLMTYAKMEKAFLDSITQPLKQTQYLKERLPFQAFYQRLNQYVLNAAIMKNSINKVMPLLLDAQETVTYIQSNANKQEALFKMYKQLSQISATLVKVKMVFANQRINDAYGYANDVDLIINQCEYLRDCLKRNIMPDLQLLQVAILPELKNLIEKMNIAKSLC